MSSLRLPPLPSIRDIIKLYRLSAIKQLSQNFLMNEKLTDKIVKCTGKISGAHVLEVGPGPGSITRSIIRKQPHKIVIIEKDRRFKPILNMLHDAFSYTQNKMEIIFDDIMNVNMKKLLNECEKKKWNEECPNIYVIGNLPFNISTPLIVKLLRDISNKEGIWSNGRVRMTLTFQKEVAERLIAEVGDHQRCRLSVIAQAWTEPKLKFIIPGSAFVPKPDVDVGVVSFTPLKKPRTNHEFSFFEKVNRHLFSFRQKYSVKCTGTLFPPDCREQLSLVMHTLAEIDPKTRPFNLTVQDIDKLATAYKYLCKLHPEIINYEYRASRKVVSKQLTRSVITQEYKE